MNAPGGNFDNMERTLAALASPGPSTPTLTVGSLPEGRSLGTASRIIDGRTWVVVGMASTALISRFVPDFGRLLTIIRAPGAFRPRGGCGTRRGRARGHRRGVVPPGRRL